MTLSKDIKKTIDLVTLGQEHIVQVMELQSIALKQLENKELCVSLSRKEYLDVLGEKGLVLGAMAGEELVAFTAFLFPGNDPENLGLELDLPKEELSRVCHFEIAFVDPLYRGQGLQYQLATRAIRAVQEREPIDHFCATIEPGNLPSLKSNLMLNFSIAKIKKMYGGLQRFILYRDFSCPVDWDKNSTVKVYSADIGEQQELLKAGWRGIAIEGKSETAFTVYCKRKG